MLWQTKGKQKISERLRIAYLWMVVNITQRPLTISLPRHRQMLPRPLISMVSHVQVSFLKVPVCNYEELNTRKAYSLPQTSYKNYKRTWESLCISTIYSYIFFWFLLFLQVNIIIIIIIIWAVSTIKLQIKQILSPSGEKSKYKILERRRR